MVGHAGHAVVGPLALALPPPQQLTTYLTPPPPPPAHPPCLCIVQDPDLRELRDTREWLDMMSTVKGGMTREQKVLLRAEARVSNPDTHNQPGTLHIALHLETLKSSYPDLACQLKPVVVCSLSHQPGIQWQAAPRDSEQQQQQQQPMSSCTCKTSLANDSWTC